MQTFHLSSWQIKNMGASINSIRSMDARQKAAKKRNINELCEHFELLFDAADAASADL
ncbi:MAG: hypothetical protein AB1717_04175 [Pseudomonadota bacterium]